jgi:phosphoribosyl 1,2-cyclic phosphodiesterase
MRVKFWGVRGSIATPGPRTALYGGNTPCVEIRAGDELIIVDAGTGIRELGADIINEKKGHDIKGSLFIGHTHWDHIQGFPFFSPFYLPTSRFTVYGVHGTTKRFEDVMAGQMQSSYFPVTMDELTCRPQFVQLDDTIHVGPVTVSYHYLNHPGITLGFRFKYAGRTVSYISDHEPYGKLNAAGQFSDKEDAAVARFVEGSDLLICEAQYTADEYRLKKGWGHSSFDDVLDLAQKAGVKKLALFHHDPAHDDAAMAALELRCQQTAASRNPQLSVFAAREGSSLEL